MNGFAHDSRLGKFCSIGPMACVCGNVKVGDFNRIGAGSIIRDGCSLVSKITVGAGSTVVKSLTVSGLYIGTPAILKSMSKI